ncbi:uncharacterized protein E0L32_010011 [Thyridium curvatum]|uniref:Zn(2)-C6 fungal-type domain-containing protein n=1 Tax=Thyridium curvatum TaxID=1093900 RepID=A0A507APW2_9PEZI|nr:uncharacterized protein E0L32_010011 [Thyridium curvatum]TPX08524.1 hypothetical protein E0L32_010011 [Thyridium curvatum]
MSPAPRSQRACDSCRIRKVKCDNGQPCTQCSHFKLPCVVSSGPSKRQNPIRGRLVARARGENDLGNLETGPGRPASAPIPAPSGDSPRNHRPDTLFESLLTPTGYTTEFFMDLIPSFEQLVYPVNPVITPDDIAVAIGNIRGSFEDAALVYAFAAVTTFLTQRSATMHGAVATQMDDLMQHSLAAHKRVDLQTAPDGRMVEEPPINAKRVMTCIFLEISMMAFKRFDRSFALLREAITMLQTVKVHQLSGTGSGDATYQRLYWETYIHERFLTIASGYPSVLPPLKAGFPAPDSTVPAYVELGFNRLISLFLIMDRPLLAYWEEQQGIEPSTSDITPEWVEQKQIQLDQDEASTYEADKALRESGRGALTEFQLVDLYITRVWLRTLVWQLALSRGLLQSAPPETVHEGLSLNYPAHRLSTELRSLVNRMESVGSIATQGSGIIQKLFEITSTIADVLALPLAADMERQEEAAGHVADLVFLVKFLFQFERIREQQKAYLQEKLDMLQKLYPAGLNSHDLS